jgi:hypothetical protein
MWTGELVLGLSHVRCVRVGPGIIVRTILLALLLVIGVDGR